MSTAAVILAAGGSRRLGRTKQLEPWGSSNLLGHVVARTRQFPVDEIWVVLGHDADVCDAPPYDLNAAQRLFLCTRADTIYGGSNQIQRNIIGERALGLPAEPKVGS